MKRILIVKVTSLGDVIQTLPVAADIKRVFPNVEIDWVVDASCAEVVRWSTCVSRVLCVPLRRFKKMRQWADFQEILQSIRTLRSVRYDAVIDLHGVYKSAIIAFLARSQRRFGYCNQDLGERGAMFAYSHRFSLRSTPNAWHSMRVSAAQALRYEPSQPANYAVVLPPAPYSLPVYKSGTPYVLFFHATSCHKKKWPIVHWVTLGLRMAEQGMQVLLPWGSASEHEEAQKIAGRLPNAVVLPHLSILELTHIIYKAALIIGVDTGLVHLSHALSKPTIMLFLATSRELFQIAHPSHSISIGDEGKMPTVNDVLAAAKQIYTLGG